MTMKKILFIYTVLQLQLQIYSQPMKTVEIESFADLINNWYSVNDGVMGGISTGGMKNTENESMLSLEIFRWRTMVASHPYDHNLSNQI